MSFCTYTAQGSLFCTTEKKSDKAPHYSTVGFDNDARAGTFIEPFSQDTHTEKFGPTPTNNKALPSWMEINNEVGSFGTCTGCKYNSCRADSTCSLDCKCSSCPSGTLISPLIKQRVNANKVPTMYYCGGNSYSTNACTPEQNALLKCPAPNQEASQEASVVKSEFYFQ